jgi:hypothetical protein
MRSSYSIELRQPIIQDLSLVSTRVQQRHRLRSAAPDFYGSLTGILQGCLKSVTSTTKPGPGLVTRTPPSEPRRSAQNGRSPVTVRKRRRSLRRLDPTMHRATQVGQVAHPTPAPCDQDCDQDASERSEPGETGRDGMASSAEASTGVSDGSGRVAIARVLLITQRCTAATARQALVSLGGLKRQA